MNRQNSDPNGQQPQHSPVDEEATEREVVEEQDFAARSVLMSNALQGGVSPVAGGLTADEELGLDPTLDEEEAAEQG